MEASIESTSSPKAADHLLVESAVELSLVEIVIGSTLHNLHVPFSGHFLSLNQSYFYSSYQKNFMTRLRSVKFLIELSVIVSLMKSMSPSLKKLGPMMSISMQGLLYSLGIALLGVNLMGQVLGAMLLSLWAFVQPLMSLFLLYGADLLHAYNYYDQLLSKYFTGSLEVIFFLFVGTKVFLAALTPLLAQKFQAQQLLKFSHGALLKRRSENRTSTGQGMIRELTKPLFLVSFIVMFCFFYLESENGITLFYKFARFMSVSMILIFVFRSHWIKNRLTKFLARFSFGRELLRKAGLAYEKILALT